MLQHIHNSHKLEL